MQSEEKDSVQNIGPDANQIVFYSNGSSFSPVIILEGEATVTWTWDDNTTSNSTTPVKEYGSDNLRKNSLIVNPWSAVRRINIGYDALDGGSETMELVADQKVSLVENLNLVAPYLKEWCSSYNNLTSLDFSNFTNLETIECYNSVTLKNVKLSNTPKLKRVCFEDNDLLDLDMHDCNSLEDLRGAMNNFSTVVFPTRTEKLWHICIRDSPISDSHLFSNLSRFPMISQLWIPNINQQGDFILPKTNYEGNCSIWGWHNKYSTLDLRGSYQNKDLHGFVDMSFNELTRVEIAGCFQIKELFLQNNKLESATIDQILKQVDDYGTSNGKLDLRNNQPPSSVGWQYKANLEKRGWTVYTDGIFNGNLQNMEDSSIFNLYPDLYANKVKVVMNKIPHEGLLLEVWNESGIKLINQKILTDIYELPLKFPGIYIFTLRSRNWVKTKKFICQK